MNFIRFALPILIALQGCIVAVQDDGAYHATPAPAPVHVHDTPPPQAAGGSLRLKYTNKLDAVFEAARKTLEQRRFVVKDTRTRGDDNWWISAIHRGTNVRVDFHRRDHKTFTTVQTTINYGSDYEVHRLAKDIHDGIGKNLGEEGRD